MERSISIQNEESGLSICYMSDDLELVVQAASPLTQGYTCPPTDNLWLAKFLDLQTRTRFVKLLAWSLHA
ncbi:hypothetical protein BC830DRAFT_164531 [Chytriomyces sp. MP71]|nr:hypothetical protein BC830DRAFT_164531 [Chytriomyces sp. MP71]